MATSTPRARTAWREVAAWWRPRRLGLAGLSPTTRALAGAALLAWVLAAAVVISIGLGVDLPGGVEDVARQGDPPRPVARSVTAVGFVGLACASAALMAAAAQTSARWSRLVRLAIGLTGMALGGQLVELGRLVATYADLIVGRELFVDDAATVVRVLGFAAIGFGLALAGLPRRWIRRWPRSAAALATTPFLCGLAAYVYLRLAATGEVSAAWGIKHPQALVAQTFVALVAGAGFVIGAILLWLAVAGARASRDVGRGLGGAARRWPSLLLWLLALKLCWLAAGYLDVLPRALGGSFDSWHATREDDWLSWLTVGTMGMLATVLLLRERPPERARSEREPLVAAAIVVGAFVAFLVLTGLTMFVFATLGIAPDSDLRQHVVDLFGWFNERERISNAVVVYAAGALGAVLLALGRWRVAGAFLLLLFAWSLARAIDITSHDALPSSDALGTAELASLDTAITLALVLVAAVWTRRGDERGPRELVPLALILGASTALVYGGQLLTVVWASGAFYVALIFPAAYRMLFDARSLNRAAPDREVRVLAFVGVSAALLVVAAVQLGSGFIAPDSPGTGQLGRLLLGAPLAAVLVALAIGAERRSHRAT